jgi:hypothetical protein
MRGNHLVSSPATLQQPVARTLRTFQTMRMLKRSEKRLRPPYTRCTCSGGFAAARQSHLHAAKDFISNRERLTYSLAACPLKTDCRK